MNLKKALQFIRDYFALFTVAAGILIWLYQRVAGFDTQGALNAILFLLCMLATSEILERARKFDEINRKLEFDFWTLHQEHEKRVNEINQAAERRISDAERKVTEKWLRTAETACYELRAASVSAKKMRPVQGAVCKDIEMTTPNVSTKELQPLKILLTRTCHGCSFHLADLQNHADNAFQIFSDFINDNCDESECKRFHDRVDERAKAIESAYDGSPATTSIITT